MTNDEFKKLPFRDRMRYLRDHGMQLAVEGITPEYRERYDRDKGVREILETGTNTTIRHYRNDDSRQDVHHRPGSVPGGKWMGEMP